MSRSYLTGWLTGLVASVLALAVLSLAVPLSPPQHGAGVVESAGTGGEAAPGTETSTDAAGAEGAGDAPAGGSAPLVTIVEVPEGSEFAGQTAPADAQAPTAAAADAAPAPGAAPESEAAPALVETQPAAAPAAGTAEAPAAPGPVATGDPASEPTGEQPAAVAPATPDLGATEAAEEGPAHASGAGQAGGPPTPGQSVAAAEAPSAGEDAAAGETADAAQPEPVAGAADATISQPPETSAPEDETLAEAPEAAATPQPAAGAEEATMPEVSDATASDEEAVAESPEGAATPEPASGGAGSAAPAAEPADVAVADDQSGVPGVTILRLPGTGEGAAEGQEAAADAAAALEPADTGPAGPLVAHAAAWSNPEGRPALAVVLLDIGPERGGASPEMIAALPFAATIAIDPQRADAAASAAAYRAAGSEVALLVESMPAGATPADLEVAYQSFVQALPEAVALVGNPQASFLRSSLEAQHVAALLAADGRGLVTYQAGLNLARRAAERAGTPVATIEKLIDPAGAASGAVGRELDRAAFNATQKGTAVIALPATPDLMAALAAWAAGPSAAAVSLAPVSALMLPETEAVEAPAEAPAELAPEDSGSSLPGQKVGTFTDTD